MSLDPESILPSNDPLDETENLRELARDLYDSLMMAMETIWFDVPFNATANRTAAEACIRARRVLGIPNPKEKQ